MIQDGLYFFRRFIPVLANMKVSRFGSRKKCGEDQQNDEYYYIDHRLNLTWYNWLAEIMVFHAGHCFFSFRGLIIIAQKMKASMYDDTF